MLNFTIIKSMPYIDFAIFWMTHHRRQFAQC